MEWSLRANQHENNIFLLSQWILIPTQAIDYIGDLGKFYGNFLPEIAEYKNICNNHRNRDEALKNQEKIHRTNALTERMLIRRPISKLHHLSNDSSVRWNLHN